ncbi:MAG: phosphatase PAP2 family protein [Tannerellaceae bacterium]|nr:phosphatase PAP2 family protein [Tannerellaceae bacterium]
MKTTILSLFLLCILLPAHGQEYQLSSGRKAVKTSGDVLFLAAPVAALTTVLVLNDWQGLKQGAFTGLTTLGVSYGLKYAINKRRPDDSDNHSFPSFHTGASFAGAAFLQKRYGWKWGAPAYVVAGYVGWSRTYGKKHDWWDVLAGAAIGVGSAYLYTRPFADNHNLSIAPVASPTHFGFHAQLSF